MTPEDQNTQFSAWLSRHAAVLHHVANGFAEGSDRHDLMQEMMLAVWRAIPAYRAGAQPSTFIYRVAHNTALTWRRTQKNYRQRVERWDAEGVPEPGGESRRNQEALAHVYAAIRRLPPLDRSLILLHLDGLDYAAIAGIHGLTESNVGARLTRLRQRLTTDLKAITHELR